MTRLLALALTSTLLIGTTSASANQPLVATKLFSQSVEIKEIAFQAKKLPSLASLKVPKTVGTKAAPPADAGGNGPWTVRVVMRSSKDGITFSGREVVMDQAGVPNLLITSNGDSYAYYQDWANGNAIGVAVRKSGKKKWDHYLIHVAGFDITAGPNGVDPSAVELPNGQIRIYWMQRTQGFRVYSATATKGPSNGIIFKLDKKFALDYAKEIFDPTVVKTKSGWVMWVDSLGTPVYATSKDGLSFTVKAGNPLFSNPDTFPWGASTNTKTGEIRVIASIQGPGGSAGVILGSTDGGRNFSELGRGAIPASAGADSSIAYNPKTKSWFQLLSERMN